MGSYAALPGRRFPMDVDGTDIFVTVPDQGSIHLSTKDIEVVLSPDSKSLLWSGGAKTYNFLTVVFPELRDVYAMFLACQSEGSGVGVSDRSSTKTPWDRLVSIRYEVSRNTIDGVDGDWESFSVVGGVPLVYNSPTYGASWSSDTVGFSSGEKFSGYTGYPSYTSRALDAFRTGSVLESSGGGDGPALLSGAFGIKSLRVRLEVYDGFLSHFYSLSGVVLETFHLYGTAHSTVGIPRVCFWHSTESRELLLSDASLENVRVTETSQFQFRLKNTSTSLRSTAIVAYEDSPSGVGKYRDSLNFSMLGSDFSRRAFVPSLEPGEESSVITCKRTRDSSSALGLHSLRVGLRVSAWEEA